MIRIFVVGFSTDKGGVESYISNLCSNLDKKEYEIILCWPEMKINGKTWICPQNRHNYIKYASFWTRFFKENKFDVIYYNTCDIVSIDMLRFAKLSGVKVRIIHSHSTENQLKMNAFHRISEKINRRCISRYANCLLACSEEAGKWMFPYNEFQVISNGIDLEKFSFSKKYRNEIRSCLGLNNEFVIGCLGRLDNEKNPLRSFAVMETVINENKNVCGIFIGDGEYREELENAVKSSKHSEKFFLLGPKDDAYKWYSAFDCLLMPSLFEGLPFVLVEAQCSGLPCVVSSSVSEKSNICGLVDFVSLEEDDSVWANKVIEKNNCTRTEHKKELSLSGYDIKITAKTIDDLIKGLLYEKSNS